MSSSNYTLNENNSYELEFKLKDSDGSTIALAALSTLICTQYYYNSSRTLSDKYHLATINGRYNQNVKNANDVVVSNTGTVTWEIQPDDTQKINSSTEQELHVVLFTWQWDAPQKQNSHTFYFEINKVPYAT